uniref:SFRICE_027488 n=1 Tax=Spodoptera frugiperda TaxID=7108 RepID=A0A2H1WRV5_SPOFR
MSISQIPESDFIPDKEGCYIKELNDYIPFGHNVTIGNCMQVTCEETLMEFATCGVFVRPNCVEVQDLSKPYPECCPTEKCEGVDDDTEASHNS